MPKARAAEPTLLFEADPTLLTTTVRIVFLTGSSSEPKDKAGLANIVSELVLRGTKKRSRGEFQAALERMGAGFDVGAAHDKTIFSGEVIRENTQAFFKLIQETISEPTLSKKELDLLRTETLAEINNVKNSNGALAGMALRRVAFEGSRLSVSGSGTLSSVKAIDLADVKAFYKQHYSQANMVVAVASPLPEKEIRSLVEKLAAKLPEGVKNSSPTSDLKVPARPTLVVVDKPGTATGTVFMGQGGMTAQDPDRFAMEVGNFSFGGEPLVSRLFRKVRGELGYTYSISSTYSAMGSLSYQKGMFAIVSTPSVEFTTKTIRKSLQMWSDYRTQGVDREELDLASDSIVNSYPFDFESADKRLAKRLYCHLYGVPLLSPADYAKTIRGVTNDGIKKAIAKHQSENGWWITLVADANAMEKQLAEEQKGVPAAERLEIGMRFTPDELVR
ncbi:insulinase family protein [bacterium]|nr:insulinase family protein [bacterium]